MYQTLRVTVFRHYSDGEHLISAMSLSLSLTGGDIPRASWKERIQHTQSRDHSSGKFIFSFILIHCSEKTRLSRKKKISSVLPQCLSTVWWHGICWYHDINRLLWGSHSCHCRMKLCAVVFCGLNRKKEPLLNLKLLPAVLFLLFEMLTLVWHLFSDLI